jgi:hypothetical protein
MKLFDGSHVSTFFFCSFYNFKKVCKIIEIGGVCNFEAVNYPIPIWFPLDPTDISKFPIRTFASTMLPARGGTLIRNGLTGSSCQMALRKSSNRDVLQYSSSYMFESPRQFGNKVGRASSLPLSFYRRQDPPKTGGLSAYF